MENASKALLMAAGVLIAIMVTSLLIYAFGNISNYQKDQSDLKKVTQLADFNAQFTQFARDDVMGTDLISLVNMVRDYNQKDPSKGAGEINYEQKITITITGLGDFIRKYNNESDPSKIFGKKWDQIGDVVIRADNVNNNVFINAINTQRELEKNVGLKVLDVLASDISNLEEQIGNSGITDPTEQAEFKKHIKELIGKDTITYGTGELVREMYEKVDGKGLDTIKQHREYAELKTSKFRCEGEPEYENGQISAMKFKFVK